jgi:DNA-binding XRE family transcriptional regulator
MTDPALGNYLRMHRIKAGLSQREVANLLGYARPWQVSRHELSKTAPPLLTALAYQHIFQMPVSALFTGMHMTVADVIEQKLSAFERDLQDRSGKGHMAKATAHKLQWLTQRKSLA